MKRIEMSLIQLDTFIALDDNIYGAWRENVGEVAFFVPVPLLPTA